ncbi:MAG TPA: pyridoxamine 5'-phosphate oxidase family protein [Flavisolibacter sp.]|jgi:hypothetical protein|nr:pyridoxamine 5'-phosphate oxidase family protein [Flavisolibacter sp.]
MATNQQLNFLQEKIKEIGSAIFFNLSDSVLKLPTSIVSTLKVDDYGYVWFFIQKPKQHLKEFDPEFPVRLDFFRKGTSYFLQVCGKGWVVNDPEEINSFDRQSLNINRDINGMVLVKVKIMKAEYYETKTSTHNSWWQNAFSSVTTWFRNSNHYRPETYFPAS